MEEMKREGLEQIVFPLMPLRSLRERGLRYPGYCRDDTNLNTILQSFLDARMEEGMENSAQEEAAWRTLKSMYSGSGKILQFERVIPESHRPLHTFQSSPSESISRYCSSELELSGETSNESR